MERHAHPLPFFHGVLTGRVVDASDLPEQELGRASLVFHPAGSAHATAWQGPGSGFAVELSAARAAEWARLEVLPREPVALPPGFASALLFAARREAHRADAAAAAAVEQIALEIAAELARLPGGTQEAGAPPWLRRVRDAVCDTYADPLPLAVVAEQVGVHPVHLARAFRRHFGETVGACVRRRRVEAACRRIVATEDPLTSIALDAGFADQAHFSRTFKRHVGMRPSDYASLVRGPLCLRRPPL
jgi:AraC family transcriptional regulator